MSWFSSVNRQTVTHLDKKKNQTLSQWTPKSSFLTSGIWKSPLTDLFLNSYLADTVWRVWTVCQRFQPINPPQICYQMTLRHFCLSLHLKLKQGSFVRRHTAVKPPSVHMQCDVFAVCLHSNCCQDFTAHFADMNLCVVLTLTMQCRFFFLPGIVGLFFIQGQQLIKNNVLGCLALLKQKSNDWSNYGYVNNLDINVPRRMNGKSFDPLAFIQLRHQVRILICPILWSMTKQPTLFRVHATWPREAVVWVCAGGLRHHLIGKITRRV